MVLRIDIPPTSAQVERAPDDIAAVSPGRYASAYDDDPQHPNDKRKRPNPFAHIVLPDDGETPGAGDF